MKSRKYQKTSRPLGSSSASKHRVGMVVARTLTYFRIIVVIGHIQREMGVKNYLKVDATRLGSRK